MFGKSPFGSSNTSAFGTGSSLFGSSANRPATAFGTQTTTQSTGLFGQKSLFGSPGQTTSLFGSTQPASTASTSIFGQSKPLFGSSATTQSSGFGGTTSLFGSTQPAQQPGSIFGTGFGSTAISGTTVKFDPPTATDTMLRNGTNQTISTKHMCITAMKQYENKSLEELRCEDYLANRKGVQSGGLAFGQASQPSTSLFGSSATTTQSSIFGQNKPLFGSSTTGFGTTTTTASSLFGTPTTSTSIFGSKPATGGLFGASATTSSFGQPQTSTGLFGSKPATSSSLFGGSAFNTAASTASPFSFGSNTTTTSTPFGQTQPPFSSFGGFQQPAASTATTGLFGAKPATSGFGGFGTSTSTASPFGTQQSGGLFGSKPATGSLFGSTTGNLFGQPAASSAPSFFGSTAAKPTNTLFGSATNQPVFGSTQQTAPGVASAAPIILGASVSQSLIENAMIEAQLATSPYGDNPLLKLLTTKSQEKSDMPNPVSIERQMRFLSSRKEAGAMTTTTASGPLALGSIPAAGSRINALNKTSTGMGDFSYRSMFSPPALRSGSRNASLTLDSSANRSHGTNNSVGSREGSGFLELNIIQTTKSKKPTHVKRLDLSVLHKSVQESRRRSTTTANMSLSSTARSNGVEAADSAQIRIESDSNRPTLSMTPGTRRTSVSFQLPPDENPPSESVTSAKERGTPTSPQSILRKPAHTSQPSISAEEREHNITQDSVTDSTASTANDDVTSLNTHPAGIVLTRRDYECEPSLAELAEMANQNGGVCHIESGFTIRRLAFGSVFWPGPFDLRDVNLDKVVHFRQHEVIVYPDDSSKPPLGEQLNRFAEVSLDRVWPRDKKTKEYITDALRLEEMGYRAKLERASLKMGAEFKDYRPETGTWVFTVPHFTKYGLMDDDDDELDEVQLRAALNDSRIQDAVQRAKLPKFKVVQEQDNTDAGARNSGFKDALSDLKQVEQLPDSVYFVRGLGGSFGYGESFLEKDSLFDATSYVQPTLMSEMEHKMELYDSKVVLEDLLADSMMIDVERNEEKVEGIQMRQVEPSNDIESFIREGEQAVRRMASKAGTFIDASLINERSGRVGWSAGRLVTMSDLPKSLSVQFAKIHCINQVSTEYILDLFQQINPMSKVVSDEIVDLVFQNSPQRNPEGDFLNAINCLMNVSKASGILHDLSVWELCDALFSSQFTANSDYTRMLNRREDVAKWLQKFLTKAEMSEKLPSSAPGKILYHMLNGDLVAAVEVAIDSSYPHLAFALSTFKYSNRTAYKNQISHWEKTKECSFINEDLLKIYLMMAGQMEAEINGKKIFVNDGLDGLRAFGVFVWYFGPFDASLKEVLRAFESDLAARKAENTLQCDVFYELIRLACDQSYSLEAVLEPNYSSVDPMDYHLSWHLWFVLRILGFQHLSKFAEHTLHTRYAEQLYQMDLPHLAAFVLMHIPDLESRNNALIELGDRIADKVDEDIYTKMSTFAQVPDCIIARSKYIRSKLENDEAKMCLYALQGGMLDDAHSIFFERVAPNAIVSDDYDFLGELGGLFEEVSDRIPAWGPGGQIFTDFYRMKKKLDEIEDDAEMKEILDLAHSIELRLISMSVSNQVQRLSASVMSSYVFKLIYGFEGKETENLPFSYEDTLDIATDLVLPSIPKDTAEELSTSNSSSTQ